MVESMTGFGKGEAHAEGISAEVEIRSVNNRFCDVSVRLPRHLSEFEYEIQQVVKKVVGRGKVNVHVRIDRVSDGVTDLHVDRTLVGSYKELLEQLRQSAGITEEIRLEHVLTFSDVFVKNESDSEMLRSWNVAKDALDSALVSFREMRLAEGRALADDLNARLDEMKDTVQEIEVRAPARVEEAADKLRVRIQTLIDDIAIDESRVAAETALLADRLDITEECVRLIAHIAAFRDALNGDQSEGRKLNFLTQEMHREVNTIGSKANDFSISQLSVRLKEELEKIREQVQNIQ
jgi:uncharacterized protein (TIGR00255 family)